MICVATNAQAQGDSSDTAASADQSKGILPIPNYGGDIWSRNYLTGDWGGKRTEWANKGGCRRRDRAQRATPIAILRPG